MAAKTRKYGITEIRLHVRAEGKQSPTARQPSQLA
jgi:hypothetical protein